MGIIYGIEELPDRHEKYEIIKNDVVENDVDVCIVGSGAAGAVLAKELVESGMKVILLERGGYYEGKGYESAGNRHDASALEECGI